MGASMAQWGNGTKPISVMGSNREKPRRESLAGSLVGGMSWGGVSVGSWIRDEFVLPISIISFPPYYSFVCTEQFDRVILVTGALTDSF